MKIWKILCIFVIYIRRVHFIFITSILRKYFINFNTYFDKRRIVKPEDLYFNFSVTALPDKLLYPNHIFTFIKIQPINNAKVLTYLMHEINCLIPQNSVIHT